MSELTTFLLAQLDADEAVARAATPGPWEAWSGASAGGGEYISSVGDVRGYTFGISPGITGNKGYEMARDDAAHIAAHDPARVLVEVEAKRAIVTKCSALLAGRSIEGAQSDGDDGPWLAWETLRLLAVPFADRPGFDETWRP